MKQLVGHEIYSFMSISAASFGAECVAPQAFPNFDVDTYIPLQPSSCKYMTRLLQLCESETIVNAVKAAQWRAIAM